ncbi:helix-turn-helix domain-containing protein [Celeribacter sp. HF31]|nr:helix-turn-helix domain-containing protein [Celeribacter sp. HF31]
MSHISETTARAASEMLTTEEAAALLGVTRRFLDKDRHVARQNGTPPAIPYSNLGHRTVRYSRADVLAFLDANRVD